MSRYEFTIASIVNVIKALPVTEQIGVVQKVIDGADFADFDGDELDRLEVALNALLSESREADHAEDRRMHGDEVRL